MGTRHLTAVFLDGKYKIAQYGQWDGYPEGAGMNCLKFVRTIIEKTARDKFANKVRNCSWATQRYIDNKTRHESWQKEYPELLRDTGSDILQIIKDSDRKIKLDKSLNFVADGLMCEWAWVIDLDSGTFEAFKGFNHQPLAESDRFYFLDSPELHDYHPARLVAKWQFDNLPSDDEFIKAFKGVDQYEDSSLYS